MLWLIWIAIMLLVPVFAGVQVWFQINHAPVDLPATISTVGIAESHAPDA